MSFTMLGRRVSVGPLAAISQQLLHNISFRYQRVQCIRVGNTEIPDNKRLNIALQRIYGIGRQRAGQILSDLSITNKLTRDLTGIELNSLREEVSKYLIAEDLRRRVKGDIQRLIDNRCHRGYRHVCFLPCRGQRTKTNSRTIKEHKKQSSGNRARYDGLADWMEKRHHQEMGK